ncbi:MAG: hypothetical protein R2838_03895 [Caldilineaceae bacterium]
MPASNWPGELIVSTDPDIYAPVDWVARLVAAYFTHYGVIVGSYHAAARTPSIVQSISASLTSGCRAAPRHAIDIAPTANVLYPRIAPGNRRLDGTGMVGDTLMSWEYTRLGIPLIFMPDAVVEHHHLSAVAARCASGGCAAASLPKSGAPISAWSARHTLFVLLLTLLPLRLLKLTARTLRHGWRSRQVAAAWRALPVILLAHGAAGGRGRGLSGALLRRQALVPTRILVDPRPGVGKRHVCPGAVTGQGAGHGGHAVTLLCARRDAGPALLCGN